MSDTQEQGVSFETHLPRVNWTTAKDTLQERVKCAVRDCPNDGESKNRLDVEAVHGLGWFRVYLCGDCHNSLSRDAFEKFTGVKLR